MKKDVLLICGGQSPEHEISIISARNVFNCLKDDFNVLTVTITRNGIWYLHTLFPQITSCDAEKASKAQICYFMKNNNGTQLYTEKGQKYNIDVVFPLVHGVSGEDGMLQGMLELYGMRYVGSNITSSVSCMNKILTKKILSYHNINIVPFLEINKQNFITYFEASERLGVKDMVVKPCNSGSSIGVSIVRSEAEYEVAIKNALQYSVDVLVEEMITGIELECSIIEKVENSQRILISSDAGQIVVDDGFYSYEAKYCNQKNVVTVIPASITREQHEMVANVAESAFKALKCRGWARVDFLMDSGNLYVNEINTIPGCTSISMYTKLLELKGISQKEIFKTLVELTLDEDVKLAYSYYSESEITCK
ncbi:D-alanine--D-alanine ligase family protein [Candidatus Fokinia crypta]|uniref:D-alanine--D-alanine ligase n=1 Tax=Candidatus Fokinia crypta TaxID=1920990 RepID=A0ABZ0UNI4_9RICK|nr:D-alanine--D-alanine ligase family protein [Candidatus Fokinia cryptica]WPX97688.1 D-alanine--D-alanine ligase A [Candidatus Fokinia cryptica]